MTITPAVSKRRVISASASQLVSLSTILEQAEVCREQAREAGRLKRLRSALGLFATANALCRHVEAQGTESEQRLATERLASLAIELAAYGELARSLERSKR